MTPVVEVRVAEDSSALVLSGRNDLELRQTLRAAGFTPGRARNGVAVPALQSPELLKTNNLLGSVHWRPDAERFAKNRWRARASHSKLLSLLRELRTGGRDGASGRIADVPDQDKLDDHQVVNVAALVAEECYGLCLFDEQGAGKTVSVVYAWDLLAQRRVTDLLVVVAPKSMAPEWRRDIERFRPTLYKMAVLDGSRSDKRRALAQRLDVVVVGFDTAVSLESELTSLIARRTTTLVVDESFTVKNPEALRTGALRRMREWAERCWVLCGTPAPNAPQDIKAQVDLADLGIAFAGVDLPQEREEAAVVVGSVLDERVAYLRSLKRDVLPDLPQKRFDLVAVDLAPRQQQIYASLRDGLVDELQNIDDLEYERRRASFMARRTAMLQVCSHPRAVDGGYCETPAKLAAVRSIVERRIEADEKVVVWSFFRFSLEALFVDLGPFGAVRYDGSVVSMDERRDAVRRFQEDPATRVFVGNPAAAGAGLTLTAARCAVFESFSNQAAHYLQSIDRVHRRGQEREVEYVVLLASNTVEEAAYERLQRKEHEAQDLLRDAADKPLTRQALLSELTGEGSPGDG